MHFIIEIENQLNDNKWRTVPDDKKENARKSSTKDLNEWINNKINFEYFK